MGNETVILFVCLYVHFTFLSESLVKFVKPEVLMYDFVQFYYAQWRNNVSLCL